MNTLSNNPSMFKTHFLPAKCKMLPQNWSSSGSRLIIQSEIVEYVDQLIYFRGFIIPSRSLYDEILSRIHSTFVSLSHSQVDKMSVRQRMQ